MVLLRKKSLVGKSHNEARGGVLKTTKKAPAARKIAPASARLALGGAAPKKSLGGSASYSAQKFDAHHESFKNETSRFGADLGVKLLGKAHGGNVLLLDDFPKHSRSVLRSSGIFKKASKRFKLWVVNPSSAVCQVARRQGAVPVASRLHDALTNYTDHFRSKLFTVAYLDYCTSDPDVACADLKLLLPRLRWRCLIGVTLTSRDRRGRTWQQRKMQVVQFLRARSFRQCCPDLVDKNVLTVFLARGAHDLLSE